MSSPRPGGQAAAAQECGIDIILVGDSLGMAVLGYTSTLPVTLEQSLHHCAAVRRGAGCSWNAGRYIGPPSNISK